MAGALPVSTLISEAAEAQARRARLPSPRNLEIDHFVVLMMENRSFGEYPCVKGIIPVISARLL